MDKQTALGFIVIVLLVVGVAFLIVSHMRQPVTPVYNPPNKTLPEPVQNESKTYPVTIQNLTFTPFEITVNKGDIITWSNCDNFTSTVTSDSGNELNSPILKNGDTFIHMFNTTGVYNYHSEIRTNMKGRIIVQ
ncbi:MAG: cupredoxin domain-containing protein [Candidatus Pacearchaeota archaeon]|jgi:plastocyanin